MKTVFSLPLQDVVHDVGEDFGEFFGASASLCVILREVFKDGPEVQQRAPVDVAEILQEEMLLEAVNQRVVARHEQIAKTRSVWVVGYAREFVPVERQQIFREEVPAIDIFLAFGRGTFPSTSVYAKHGCRRVAMHRVALAVFNESE